MFSSTDVQDRVTSIALVLCFKLKNHIIIYDICQFLYSFYKCYISMLSNTLHQNLKLVFSSLIISIW